MSFLPTVEIILIFSVAFSSIWLFKHHTEDKERDEKLMNSVSKHFKTVKGHK